jgi:hypothetical protein
MGLHEGFELGACLRRAVSVECAGDRQTADRLDRHIGRERRPDREAFHVAVEFAGNQPGGFENRRHRVVILGRYQNGLHAGAV